MSEREPKIKAWNKKYQFMFEPKLMGLHKNKVLCEGNWINSEDCVFLHNTKIKDDCGKDIFIGDIVKCTFNENEESVIYTVNNLEIIPLELSIHKEILGNIYENPEMRERKIDMSLSLEK